MFFRDLFASLCFIFFGFALATQHPYLFFGAMMCGCLALTAFGLANMWAAIFADVGVMIIAVLNAIRALKYKE